MPDPAPRHTYASLSVGDRFTATRTVTADDVRRFAEVSGDDNPIHLDAEAARAQGFPDAIVHGVFLTALVSKVLGRDFPGAGAVAVSISCKFLRPVPVDSEVTVEVQVAEKLERFGHVKMKVYVYRAGKMAMGGEAVLIPPKD